MVVEDKIALYRGNPIYYKVRGVEHLSASKSARALVLLHGFLETQAMWHPLADFLNEEKCCIISIDLPGFGLTPTWGYVQSMEQMAMAVSAVCVQEQVEWVDLVGHSMGGYVALAFAELYVNQVQSLCLLHSTALPDSEERKLIRDKVIATIKETPAVYTRLFFDGLFKPDNMPRFQSEIAQMRKAIEGVTPKAMVNALLGMRNRKDRLPFLKSAPFKVGFVIGRHDVSVPCESLLYQVEQVTGCEYLLLEHSAHMGQLEQQHEAFSFLKKFFST